MDLLSQFTSLGVGVLDASLLATWNKIPVKIGEQFKDACTLKEDSAVARNSAYCALSDAGQSSSRSLQLRAR